MTNTKIKQGNCQVEYVIKLPMRNLQFPPSYGEHVLSCVNNWQQYKVVAIDYPYVFLEKLSSNDFKYKDWIDNFIIDHQSL